jgi:hypothetical protein
VCPTCEEKTDMLRLDNCMKNVFLDHRRFLHSNYRYHGWRKAFNGKPEKGVAPVALTSDQLFEKVKDMSNKFGKPFAKDLVKSG